MPAHLANITFDCDNALTVATFWSAVLDRPVDDGASEWFASIGISDVERTQPAWFFSKVPEAKHAKNRMHVDITAADPNEIDRLVALGAARVGDKAEWGHAWVVMADPEGNEFCVTHHNDWVGPG